MSPETSKDNPLPRWASVEKAGLWLARLFLCVLFLYAGSSKLADPAGFAADIGNYRLLPSSWVPIVAVYLPVLEVAVALALLLPGYFRAGALLSAAMLAAFAAAMAQAKLRGIDLECGCFGAAASSSVSWFKVALNISFATLGFWTVWRGAALFGRTASGGSGHSATGSVA